MPITEPPLKIILADDNSSGPLSFSKLLQKTGLSSGLIIAATEKQLLKSLAGASRTLVFIHPCFKKNIGYGLVVKIKESHPHLPVIILLNNKSEKKASPADDQLFSPEITPALLKKSILYCLQITENKKAFSETLERYNLLTKATNNIVWDWDLYKRAAYWVGNGLREILGYPTNEMIVDTNFWENNLHPEDKDRVIGTLDNIFKKAKVNNWEDEYRFKHKNGSYVYIYDRGFIIYSEGKPVRMIGSMEDITDKKVAEASRLSSEKKYKHLFDNNPLATFIWSRENYKILDANKKAIAEYGYSRPEFLQLEVLDLRPGEDRGRFKKTVIDALDKSQAIQEYTWTHKNKAGRNMLMQIVCYKIIYNDVPAVLALAKNITEEAALSKKLEHEKNIKRKQISEAVVTAQEKERTEIGKELHDNVNQLLSASRLYIEAAKTDDGHDKTLLTQASEYIMTAIEEIRVLSKALNTPMINELGLNEAVENLADDLMAVNNIHILIKKRSFNESALRENFKLTLFRIIQEQITNVLKHSKATEATISLKRDTHEISLQVRDNGVGFDVKEKAKGIGLMNIKSRTELYRGLVNVSSVPGKGTSLLVKFPLADAIEENEDSASS